MKRSHTLLSAAAGATVLTITLAPATHAQLGPPYSCNSDPPVPNQLDVTKPPYCADPGPGTAADWDGDAIRLAIQHAAASGGADHVYLPPGKYEVYVDPATLSGAPTVFELAGLSDVLIQGPSGGAPAVVEFQDKNGRGFNLKNSSNITLKNLTFRFAGESHLEGTLTGWDPSLPHPDGVSGNVPAYTLELAPHFQGLLSDPFFTDGHNSDYSFIGIEPTTRRYKRYTNNLNADWVEALPDGVSVRLYFDSMTSSNFVKPSNMNLKVLGYMGETEPDDAVITVERKANGGAPFTRPNMIWSSDSSNLLFEDLTITAWPWIVAQHNHDTGMTYRRVSIVPDPEVEADPAIGKLGALVSANRDGLRFLECRTGPTIEDCTFERVYDDPINIRGSWIQILSAFGGGGIHQLDVVNLNNENHSLNFEVGDTVKFFEEDSLNSTGTFVVTQVTNPTGQPSSTNPYTIRVAGSPSLPTPALTDIAVNLDGNNDGFVVSGCTMREIRARGIYARGSNGLVSNNTVAGTILSGIVCSPDLSAFFKEAGFVTDLTIMGNTVHNFGYKRTHDSPSAADLGGISVGVRPPEVGAWPEYLGNMNVDVLGNFVSTGRFNALFLGSVSDGTIDDNLLLSSQLDPSSNAGSGVGINPLGANMGVMHAQNADLVERERNLIETEPFAGQIPDHTVAVGVGAGGGSLSTDSVEGADGNTTLVFSTSFEEEEPWSTPLPPFGSGDPATEALHNPTGLWSANMDGVVMSFTDWGLYGNHFRDHFYRGWISTRCSGPGAKLMINPPTGNPGILFPWKLKFWAATYKPNGTPADYTLEVQYKLRTGNTRWQVLDVIDPNTLADDPEFVPFDYSLPADVDKVRFLRKDGAAGTGSIFFLDDLVLTFIDPLEPPPSYPL